MVSRSGRPSRRITSGRLSSFRKKILDWYCVHGRILPWRRCGQPVYRLVISELLLQRTRAESVAEFYPDFFRSYPTWASLAQAQRSELILKVRPLGLWRRRAEGLLGLAESIKKRRGRLPPIRSEIESLPGVGQYIANAIELIAFGRPRPLLDVNMARVLERYFGPRRLSDIRYDPYLLRLAQDAIECDESLQLNWAVLDLAAMICTSRSPNCPMCPLQQGCKCAKGISCAKNDPQDLCSRRSR
jgi:A/G-specific adenine glycosylase